MNIKTKYDIGQRVWVNTPDHGINDYKIKKIQVLYEYGKLRTNYDFSDYGSFSFQECRLHPTKEACKAATQT